MSKHGCNVLRRQGHFGVIDGLDASRSSRYPTRRPGATKRGEAGETLVKCLGNFVSPSSAADNGCSAKRRGSRNRVRQDSRWFYAMSLWLASRQGRLSRHEPAVWAQGLRWGALVDRSEIPGVPPFF